MMRTEASLTAKVGVLVYDTSGDFDTVLRDTVALLQARGVSVAGLVQRAGERLQNGKRAMWLDDIASGQSIRLDQSRGAGATACRLDPDALAQGACLLHGATEAGADLIVVSRFGKSEAEGGGMRAEIAEAICSGVAVLVVVRPAYLDQLKCFLGGPVTLLPPAKLPIADWVVHVVTPDQLVPAE